MRASVSPSRFLSGIIPVGAFLVEHFVSNAFATRGPGAYAKQVELEFGVPIVNKRRVIGAIQVVSDSIFMSLFASKRKCQNEHFSLVNAGSTAA